MVCDGLRVEVGMQVWEAECGEKGKRRRWNKLVVKRH